MSMSENVNPKTEAIRILTNCVNRMRVWDSIYDIDPHIVRDLDILLRHMDASDDDGKVFILAQCVQMVTDALDRMENGWDDDEDGEDE